MTVSAASSNLMLGKRVVPGTAHHEADIAAAALRAHQPLAPRRDPQVGTVSRSHLGRIGFGLVAAIAAPDDEHQMRSRSAAQGRRRTGLRSHLCSTGERRKCASLAIVWLIIS